MIWVAFVLFAVLGIALQIAALTERMFAASRCICRKGAVNMECPIHGSRS